jgi:hypothetical protein
MQDDERRSMMRTITDEQYDDIMKVLAIYPHITMRVTCEGSTSSFTLLMGTLFI